MLLLPVIFAVLTTSENLADVGDIRLKGFLGERLDAMVERHVIARDVGYLTKVFAEKTERGNRWQTEFWGKYMHSAVPYQSYSGSSPLGEAIIRGVADILASQEPAGYIGNYPDELRCGEGWDVWGMKYTMMGLLHFHDWTRKGTEDDVRRGDAALAACRRLCDYIIGEIGPNGRRGRALWETGNWSGYASSSILEPVVLLYRRTKEGRYLDFASYIVKGMTEPSVGPRLVDLALKGVSVADRNGFGNVPETHGGYVMKHNRWKSYEMMSCYQGLLEYWETVTESGRIQNTPDGDLFRAALMTAEDIAAEEVNLAGGCASCEAWFHGARKQHLAYAKLQETCVTTTWMRLCEKLLCLTDDPKWADRIELSFYNAYLGALRKDGGEFAAYTPLSGSRWHGMHHCFMHTDCCTANGPRGYLCFLRELCRRHGETVTFNFYASANVQGFEMYSLYPRADSVRIVSHTNGHMKVRFRIPGWSRTATLAVNGEIRKDMQAGKYAVVEREWRLGDVVELSFGMETVAHVNDGYVAFTRGPILLARDSRLDRADLGEPFRRGIAEGEILRDVRPVRTPSDAIWMTFSAVVDAGSHHENPEARYPCAVTFCDYASAGNEWSAENYYRTWFPIERGPDEK